MSKEPISYELENFELEVMLHSGWSVIRADENEVAAQALSDKWAVHTMLAGAEVMVYRHGRRWPCRLTPKSWLKAEKRTAK